MRQRHGEPPQNLMRRPWFKVPIWIIEHLGWVRGPRLQVYLYLVHATRFSDGMLPSISAKAVAAAAGISRPAAYRALRELADPAPEISGAPHVRGCTYLRIAWGRGLAPTSLELYSEPRGGQKPLLRICGKTVDVARASSLR